MGQRDQEGRGKRRCLPSFPLCCDEPQNLISRKRLVRNGNGCPVCCSSYLIPLSGSAANANTQLFHFCAVLKWLYRGAKLSEWWWVAEVRFGFVSTYSSCFCISSSQVSIIPPVAQEPVQCANAEFSQLRVLSPGWHGGKENTMEWKLISSKGGEIFAVNILLKTNRLAEDYSFTAVWKRNCSHL